MGGVSRAVRSVAHIPGRIRNAAHEGVTAVEQLAGHHMGGGGGGGPPVGGNAEWSLTGPRGRYGLGEGVGAPAPVTNGAWLPGSQYGQPRMGKTASAPPPSYGQPRMGKTASAPPPSYGQPQANGAQQMQLAEDLRRQVQSAGQVGGVQ